MHAAICVYVFVVLVVSCHESSHVIVSEFVEARLRR